MELYLLLNDSNESLHSVPEKKNTSSTGRDGSFASERELRREEGNHHYLARTAQVSSSS